MDEHRNGRKHPETADPEPTESRAKLFTDPEAINPSAISQNYAAIAPGKPERRNHGADTPDATDMDERIKQFAPVYLTFPEGNPNVSPPHSKGGDHDYHPRVVEHFLDDARLVEVRTWARRFYLFYLSTFVVVIPVLVLLAVNRQLQSPDEAPFAWGFLVGFWVTPYLANVLSTSRSAKGGDAIRARLEDHLEDGLESSSMRVEYFRGSAFIGGLRSLVATVRKMDSSSHAWRMYTQKIESDESRYPRTIYAHLTSGLRPAEQAGSPANLVIQYWAFYYFNDWENKHPADWECVQLFFEGDCETPVAAAYSNHLGSLWRSWNNVKKLQLDDGTSTDHPLVYVALGSHAQYFEPKDIGYEAPFALNVPSFFGRIDARVVGTRAAATARERDHVVRRTSLKKADITHVYALKVAPRELQAIDPFIPEQLDWKQWWWLRFQGRWAETYQPIAGPAAQLEKWFGSFLWVEKSGQADDRWSKLFDKDSDDGLQPPPKVDPLVNGGSAARRNGSGHRHGRSSPKERTAAAR